MRIVLLGAGMIGIHIARELIEEKREVVLIEKDTDAATMASSELDCLVINDDGSKPEVLRKAGAARSDWFLALTGSDEVNIVACGLVAAESSAVRTVARVESSFYSSLSPVQRKAFGLDMLVNPTMETASAVVRIVDEGFAEDVIPLHGGKLQLRYLPAKSIEGYAGHSLKQIRQSREADFLVAAIVKPYGLLIPDGDYVIDAEDMFYLLGTPAGLDRVAGAIAGVREAARRVIIIGATKIGARLIEALSRRGVERARGLGALIKRALDKRRQIVVLESNREHAKSLAKVFQGIDIIHSDSSEEGVLEKAGADKADLVVCATESQTFNILTAQLAKTLGAKKSVAVALNDRYKSLSSVLEVDALVSVKSVVAATMLELVRRAHIRTIHDFYEDDVELVELSLGKDSLVSGKPLKELSLPKGVLVGFAFQGDTIVVPTGDTVLQGGDVVGFIARKGSIAGLERIFGGARGA